MWTSIWRISPQGNLQRRTVRVTSRQHAKVMQKQKSASMLEIARHADSLCRMQVGSSKSTPSIQIDRNRSNRLRGRRKSVLSVNTSAPTTSTTITEAKPSSAAQVELTVLLALSQSVSGTPSSESTSSIYSSSSIADTPTLDGVPYFLVCLTPSHVTSNRESWRKTEHR